MIRGYPFVYASMFTPKVNAYVCLVVFSVNFNLFPIIRDTVYDFAIFHMLGVLLPQPWNIAPENCCFFVIVLIKFCVLFKYKLNQCSGDLVHRNILRRESMCDIAQIILCNRNTIRY